MPHENISDAEVDGWLKTLGIASLCQWDVLVFLYRHQTSFIEADFIAPSWGMPVTWWSPPWTWWRACGSWNAPGCLRWFPSISSPGRRTPSGVTPGHVFWPGPATGPAGCGSPRTCGVVTTCTRRGGMRLSRASRRPGRGGNLAEEDMTHG
jgi:hypothetical protein